MLSFDTRDLAEGAVHVDGRLASTDPIWEEEDLRPEQGVHVTGRLSTAGPHRYYFSGRFEGTTTAECRRCLTTTTSPVADGIHLLFAESGDPAVEEDPDVYELAGRGDVLDLRPAIREAWILAAPAYALCREDCRGLCPTCGADLNAGPCGCAERTDPRWNALRQKAAKKA